MNKHQLNIGVFGIGAIGSVIAFSLKQKQNIYYFNRSNKSKLHLLDANNHLQEKAIQLSNSKDRLNLDWLIICIKEYHYAKAIEDISNLLSANTKVAVIRNGIHLKVPLLSYTDEKNILECMIDCPVQISKSGYFHQLKKPVVTISQGDLSIEFLSLFLTEKINIKIVEDYLTVNWEKLIESSALGGILALSGETSWIFHDPEIIAIFNDLVHEGILVAQAEGAKIDVRLKKELLEKIKNYPDDKSSSMLTDRRNGNPIEINAKNGVIAQLGKKHQIKTPLNNFVYTLLKHTNQKNK